MSLWVKIEDGAVTQCWDTAPPDGEPGWSAAVEQKDPLPDARHVYGQHYFDLKQSPVALVWPIVDFPLADRKNSMRSNARAQFQQVVAAETAAELHPDPGVQYDPTAVDTARDLLATRLAAIDAAQSHDALDVIV